MRTLYSLGVGSKYQEQGLAEATQSSGQNNTHLTAPLPHVAL